MNSHRDRLWFAGFFATLTDKQLVQYSIIGPSEITQLPGTFAEIDDSASNVFYDAVSEFPDSEENVNFYPIN
jgi:hypothetical protein